MNVNYFLNNDTEKGKLPFNVGNKILYRSGRGRKEEELFVSENFYSFIETFVIRKFNLI